MGEYAKHEHHDFMNASAQALADPGLQIALVRLTETLLAGNRRGYAALADSSALRDHAKQIKEHTLAHLDRYLEQLEASVLKVGGKVHWAADAEEGRRIVVEIARGAGCTRAVKSKSMTSEEIHLNPALGAPAVQHSRESVARVLSQHLGEKLPDDPAILAGTGRRVLREKFKQAD